MKKKILTMVMVLALVMSQAAPSFAATDVRFSGKIDLSNLCTILMDYIFNGGSQEDVGSKPQNPNEDNVVQDQSKTAQVLSLVNKERAAKGLSSLKGDSQLNKVAQLKAEDMAKKGYFSHNSPTYGSAFDMLKSHGIKYRTAGENIAKGQKTAQTVMNGWMNSTGHRANILNSSYSKLGVGYAVSANGTPYWVQIFVG
ncbi:MAG: hypothetical protein IJP00_06280 [Firmicutes bacterium]|nr:hypothetical protein [Bacillota bacterium]